MCAMCGDEKEKEKENAIFVNKLISKNLKEASNLYSQFSSGAITPHSKEWIANKNLFLGVIRSLVEDWV